MSPRGGQRTWTECSGTGKESQVTEERRVGQSRGLCPDCGKEVPIRAGRVYRHKSMLEGTVTT